MAFTVALGSAGIVDTSSLSGMATAAPGHPPIVYARTDQSGIAQATVVPFQTVDPAITAALIDSHLGPATFTADITELVIVYRTNNGHYGPYSGFFGPCDCSQNINAVTVPVGTPVEWRTRDAQAFTITAIAAPPGGVRFDSGTLPANGEFRFVPAVAGTWQYHDRIGGTTAMHTAQ